MTERKCKKGTGRSTKDSPCRKDGHDEEDLASILEEHDYDNLDSLGKDICNYFGKKECADEEK